MTVRRSAGADSQQTAHCHCHRTAGSPKDPAGRSTIGRMNSWHVPCLALITKWSCDGHTAWCHPPIATDAPNRSGLLHLMRLAFFVMPNHTTGIVLNSQSIKGLIWHLPSARCAGAGHGSACSGCCSQQTASHRGILLSSRFVSDLGSPAINSVPKIHGHSSLFLALFLSETSSAPSPSINAAYRANNADSRGKRALSSSTPRFHLFFPRALANEPMTLNGLKNVFQSDRFSHPQGGQDRAPLSRNFSSCQEWCGNEMRGAWLLTRTKRPQRFKKRQRNLHRLCCCLLPCRAHSNADPFHPRFFFFQLWTHKTAGLPLWLPGPSLFIPCSDQSKSYDVQLSKPRPRRKPT